MRDALGGRAAIDLRSVRRVLVVRADAVGDLVLTSPFLRELRRNLPEAHITLCVDTSCMNLVERCPHVDEVITYRSRRMNKEQRAARIEAVLSKGRELRGRRLDLAILPRWGTDFYLASQLVCLSGARWRIGYSEHVDHEKRVRNRGYDRYFSHVLDPRGTCHEVERNLQLLEYLGCTVEDRGLDLWLDEDDLNWAREILRPALADADGPLVGFAVASAVQNKIWPIERYVQLGAWLIREYNAYVVAVGGPGEEAYGQELAERLGTRVVNLVGPPTLRQLGAALRHCAVCVGNDTGPVHMAAAAGCRVLVISSHPVSGDATAPGAPERFRPWGEGHAVIQPAVAASACSESCKAREPHCILGVEVEDVRRELAKALSAGPAGAN
jgi:heptosyltransferase-2